MNTVPSVILETPTGVERFVAMPGALGGLALVGGHLGWREPNTRLWALDGPEIGSINS